jgi:hypothetical protein
MSTGTILFGVITLVTVTDIFVALYFRSVPARVENGETVPGGIDPDNAGKVGNAMLITAPLIWIVVTLICFGVIPSGIDPIKF